MKATPESAPASIDRFMSLLKEHENRIGETIGILQNIKTPSEQIRQAMEASSAARSAVIAEVERLAAQSAPTGLTEMGWIIDAATKGELAAYDQGCDECQQAVTKILDGKDTGAGTANAPWELLRRRLLALVAQSAPLQQAECTCAAKDMPFGRCCRAAAQVEPAELTNDQITAGYLAMLESIEVVGMDRAVQRFRDAVSKGDHQ